MGEKTQPSVMLDDFPDPVVVVDRDGKLVSASSVAAELFASGAAANTLVGSDLRSWVLPEDRQAVAWALEAAEPGGETVRIAVQVPIAQETCAWRWAVRGLGPPREGQRVISMRPSTEVRAGARRNDDETYRRIVESTRDGIWLIDARARTSFLNAQMARMLGYSAEEIIGRSPEEFLDREMVPQARRAFSQLARGRAVVQEFRFRHKNGSSVWASASVNALRNECGDFSGALGVLTDTSERRRLEEQLLQAQKMEAVGRLAGGIAHEFNNLLTTIIGAAELLSYRLANQPELRGELQGIRTASDRATSLVRRLLTFAKKQDANPPAIDICEAVRGAERILASAIGEEIDLAIEVARGPCAARVDSAQIEQVLLNLVLNGRDAIQSEGRVVVRVERTFVDSGGGALRPGEYVRLSVIDNGAGMPEEVMNRIFEPFFTTKPREYGSGLGLAIVYGIVKQAGGDITVESRVGQGSRFDIYLPASALPPEAATPAPDVGGDDLDEPRGNETVLVVEDDELVRGITVRALRALGYRILLAEDGEDALRVVEKYDGTIDIAVTDVAMPRMGGAELADRLSVRNPNLKILFVSGYSEGDLSEDIVLAKNRAFMDKPFTATMLARRLREMLDQP